MKVQKIVLLAALLGAVSSAFVACSGASSGAGAGASSDAGAADIGASDAAQSCLEGVGGGWCDTTLPVYGVSIQSIWGSAADDVWAVGPTRTSGNSDAGGTILHWDGSSWSATSTGTYPDLFGLSGTGTNDV